MYNEKNMNETIIFTKIIAIAMKDDTFNILKWIIGLNCTLAAHWLTQNGNKPCFFQFMTVPAVVSLTGP